MRKIAPYLPGFGMTVFLVIIYPQLVDEGYFRKSPLWLPFFAAIVLVCWIIPLLVHHQFHALLAGVHNVIGKDYPRMTLTLVVLIGAVVGGSLTGIGWKVFLGHKAHLDALNHDEETRGGQPTQPRPQPQVQPETPKPLQDPHPERATRTMGNGGANREHPEQTAKLEPPRSNPPITRLGKGPDAYKDISDEQVGRWTVEMADKLVRICTDFMARVPNGENPRWTAQRFVEMFNDCCSDDLKNLRYELLLRLGPSGKDPEEIEHWTHVFPETKYPQASNFRIGPLPQEIEAYAQYFRRLGLQLKHRAVPHPVPIPLKFSEKVFSSGKSDFPSKTIVTITTDTVIEHGFIVVDFDPAYVGAGTDFAGSKLVLSPADTENPELRAHLEAEQRLQIEQRPGGGHIYALKVGEKPFTPENPIRVEASGENELHAVRVRFFEE